MAQPASLGLALLYFHFLVFLDYMINLCDSRVAHNPGLGGPGDVASAIIAYDQTQLNLVRCFQILNAVFLNGLLDI